MRILEINIHLVKRRVYYSILSILMTISVITGFSQQKNNLIDSLELELKKAKTEKSKINTMLHLSDAYTFEDFQKSLKYAEDAVSLAEKLNDTFTKYRAYQRLSLAYSVGGDYTSALKYETLSLQIALAENDSINIGLSHSNIGNMYYEIGEYDEAYYYLTYAYRILQKTAKNANDSVYMNIALHNVGRVFKELGQYEVAMNHLKLSQKISEKVGDVEGGPYSLDEVGDVKLRMKQYDSALFYLTYSLQEGKRLFKKNPTYTSLIELQPKTLSKIAKVYLNRNEFDKAFLYYDSTYKIHELTSNKLGLAEVDLGRGVVYMRQNKFEEAMKSINKALAFAQEINARILEISCYKHLATLWEQKGDFKKSLEYYKQFQALDDSLFSNEMQQKLLRDQIRFETATKDDRIAALTRLEQHSKSEIRKQEFIRNILVVVVALTAILLFTVYRSGQRRKQINDLLIQHQEDMEKRSAELEQLNQVKDKFFSIISHDLRSPINALAGIMDLMDKGAIAPEELPMAIKELRTRFNHTRSLMNNLLDWTVLQMDKMNLQASNIDLHKIVDENFELSGSIQSKKINFVNETPDNCMAYADSNTVNLVIRNLITNSMKFTNDGGEIKISAEAKGNEWIIAVKDNGIGMNQDIQSRLFDKINPYSSRGTANEKGTGLGLLLCKEFVEKNGGRIWVESQENKGSTFWFTLPKAS